MPSNISLWSEAVRRADDHLRLLIFQNLKYHATFRRHQKRLFSRSTGCQAVTWTMLPGEQLSPPARATGCCAIAGTIQGSHSPESSYPPPPLHVPQATALSLGQCKQPLPGVSSSRREEDLGGPDVTYGIVAGCERLVAAVPRVSQCIAG